MKLILITLVALVVGLMVACSSSGTAQNEPTPNLEATVEALVDKELETRLWSVADSLMADTVAAC
jgi:hypothetical protein